MCDGIAPHVEPATAAGAVYPTLSEPTLWIGTDEDELAPFFIAHLVAIFWVSNSCFGTVMKFGFIARTAPWTWNMQHLGTP